MGSFYHFLDSTGIMLAQSLANRQKSSAALDSIIRIVYKTWDIGFDTRDMTLEALLPHLVYATKKGACLGVSLIILMLAERIGCPVYGVMLPGHFFCRFDDGSVRINIEPNMAGFNHTDDYYRTRYPVASTPWYDFRDLTKQETIGILCYNAGTICLGDSKNDAAVFYCRQAMRRLKSFPEAEGNCALAYAQMGKIDSSLMIFKGLFSAHPGFVNCAANYGAVLMQAGKIKEAEEVFRKGLEYFPGDTVLLKGIAKAQKFLKVP